MKKIVFIVIILTAFVCCLSGQKRGTFLEIWKLKENKKISSQSQEEMGKFKADLDVLSKRISLNEGKYFQGTNSEALKEELLREYRQKHKMVNAIKQKAIITGDEALFLELVQYIRPVDLKNFIDQQKLSENKLIVYKKWFNEIKASALGNKIKNFTLLSPEEKSVNTSKLRGKIIWVDSWASACAPCIKKLRQINSIYEKYHPKGFEILAVSWDYSKSIRSITEEEAKSDWIKAIGRYQFNKWLNVFDREDRILEGIYGSSGKNFLIDTDGTIIGFDLKPLEIEEILRKKVKNN